MLKETIDENSIQWRHLGGHGTRNRYGCVRAGDRTAHASGDAAADLERKRAGG
jgi:hypothetical protein